MCNKHVQAIRLFIYLFIYYYYFFDCALIIYHTLLIISSSVIWHLYILTIIINCNRLSPAYSLSETSNLIHQIKFERSPICQSLLPPWHPPKLIKYPFFSPTIFNCFSNYLLIIISKHVRSGIFNVWREEWVSRFLMHFNPIFDKQLISYNEPENI